MIGTGTIVNVLAIIVGGLLGLLAKGRRQLRGQDGVIHALGLATMFIGAGSALCGMLTVSQGSLTTFGTRDTLFMILALALGTAVGEWMDLDGRNGTAGYLAEGPG